MNKRVFRPTLPVPSPRRRAAALVAVVFFLVTFPTAPIARPAADPHLFGHDELIQLYEQQPLAAPLDDKLRTLLTTPFINNEATERGVRPLNGSAVRGWDRLPGRGEQ